MDVTITDQATGRHVDSAVVAIDNHVVAQGCCSSVTIETSAPHTLTVQAEGYHLWQLLINPHLTHHAIVTAPIQLEPILTSPPN